MQSLEALIQALHLSCQPTQFSSSFFSCPSLMFPHRLSRMPFNLFRVRDDCRKSFFCLNFLLFIWPLQPFELCGSGMDFCYCSRTAVTNTTQIWPPLILGPFILLSEQATEMNCILIYFSFLMVFQVHFVQQPHIPPLVTRFKRWRSGYWQLCQTSTFIFELHFSKTPVVTKSFTWQRQKCECI